MKPKNALIVVIIAGVIGFLTGLYSSSTANAQDVVVAAKTEVVKKQEPQVLYFKLNRGAYQSSEACKVLHGKWTKIENATNKFRCTNTSSQVDVRVSVAQDGIVKLIVFSFHGHRGDKLFDSTLERFKKKYLGIHKEEGSTFVFSNDQWSAYFSTPVSGKNTHTIWLYDPNFIINQ